MEVFEDCDKETIETPPNTGDSFLLNPYLESPTQEQEQENDLSKNDFLTTESDYVELSYEFTQSFNEENFWSNLYEAVKFGDLYIINGCLLSYFVMFPDRSLFDLWIDIQFSDLRDKIFFVGHKNDLNEQTISIPTTKNKRKPTELRFSYSKKKEYYLQVMLGNHPPYSKPPFHLKTCEILENNVDTEMPYIKNLIACKITIFEIRYTKEALYRKALANSALELMVHSDEQFIIYGIFSKQKTLICPVVQLIDLDSKTKSYRKISDWPELFFWSNLDCQARGEFFQDDEVRISD